MRLYRFVALFFLGLLFSTVVAGERQLTAENLAIAPLIDGNVADDPAWQQARPTSGFTQVRPDEGRAATQRTEVFVGYTDEHLYVGVICYDNEPEKIIVSDSRRDIAIEDTDSFALMIDGFLDRQNGFVFGTTPSSAEYDGQIIQEGNGGTGINLNWDTSWRVRSHVHERGWSAEFAIPFRSLRYGSGRVQDWGINFQRNIRRNNEVVFWSPLPRQHDIKRVSQAGTLNSVQVPSQRSLKITPYALGQARSGGAEGNDTRYNEEFGFDAKVTLTPSLALDLTYNTDFAQVEADDVQVNLDRFSIFFPEKRPFFLENADQFRVGTPEEVELFFSRRIGIDSSGAQQPIDAGVRLSGKVGSATNLGLLHMQTDSDDFSVLRLNQELGGRSTIGGIFVERMGTGRDDHNRTYAIDGRVGIGDNWLLSGYAAATETPGMKGDDQAWRVRAAYASEQWSSAAGYTKVGEDFNPEVGFLRRRNYRKADFFIMRYYRPDDLWNLHELRPHLFVSTHHDSSGFWESGYMHVDNHWEWQNGFEVHTGVNFIHEGVREPFQINPGTLVLPGDYDHHEAQFVVLTDEAAPWSVKSDIKIGGFFGGHRTSAASTLRYRFRDRFSSELTWNYNDVDLPFDNGAFEVNVARLRMSWSFTPKVQLQALVQYDDRRDLIATNLRFSWLQSANAGFYLVYNEIDDDTIVGRMEKRREVVLKYSRIIDLL